LNSHDRLASPIASTAKVVMTSVDGSTWSVSNPREMTIGSTVLSSEVSRIMIATRVILRLCGLK